MVESSQGETPAPQEVGDRAKQNLKIDHESLNVPEYDFENGIRELTAIVRDKIAKKDCPVIIEIAGGSASGKTSVAAALRKTFGEEAVIVSMDDYYKDSASMSLDTQGGDVINWDQPSALNLSLLEDHIEKLRDGGSIQKPIYSFKDNKAIGVEKIASRKIIIIEGMFAISDRLKNYGDVRVFVDVSVYERAARRVSRDIRRTERQPADIMKYLSEVGEPMYIKYVDGTKKNADIIIRNE